MARVRPFNMNGRSPTVPRDTHCCCSQTLNCNSTSTFSCRLECNVSLLYTGVSAVLLWAPCHCGRRVTLSAVSLWAPCHCERRVTLSVVSLWAPCHCERRVTMGAVSLWAPCHCERRVTVGASEGRNLSLYNLNLLHETLKVVCCIRNVGARLFSRGLRFKFPRL